MAASNSRPITFPQHRPLKRTALLALLLLILIASMPAAAQLPPQLPLERPATNNEDPYNTSVTPTLAILIVAFVGVFFLLTFFLIYIRCCIGGRSIVTPAAITLSGHGAQTRGLDSALLETFPTMVYSEVKGRNLGKDSLECAICLCEFEENDILRFIPICCHVFHRDCIDVWLDSHITCPVCRRNMAADPLPETDHVVIAVDQEADLTDLVRIGSQRRLRSGSVRGFPIDSVSRGDWEAVFAGGDGRFRLQLSEDMKKEILEAGRLQRSVSLGVFTARREGSLRKGYMEGGFRVWRSIRLGQSARWSVLGRSLSAMGSEAAVEGSVPEYWKGVEVASVKGYLGVMSGGGSGEGGGGGGGSRVKTDDGAASTAAYIHSG